MPTFSKGVPKPTEGEYSGYSWIGKIDLNLDTILQQDADPGTGLYYMSSNVRWIGDILFAQFQDRATGQGTLLKIDANGMTAERIGTDVTCNSGAYDYGTWNLAMNDTLGSSLIGKYVAAYEEAPLEHPAHSALPPRIRIWKDGTLLQTILSTDADPCPPNPENGGASVTISPSGEWLLLFSKGANAAGTVHQMYVWQGA